MHKQLIIERILQFELMASAADDAIRKATGSSPGGPLGELTGNYHFLDLACDVAEIPPVEIGNIESEQDREYIQDLFTETIKTKDEIPLFVSFLLAKASQHQRKLRPDLN